MAGPYDLTSQNIENTYQRILQTPDGATFYNGTGSLITLPSANTSSLLTTASVNLNTITFTKGDGSTFPITVNTGSGGSGTPTFPYTGSAIISGSLTITGSLSTNDGVYVSTLTASFISASGGITGSLFGTSSWARSSSVAISSSYSSTASYALNGGVTKIIAGGGITISPSLGLGDVTINSTAANFNTATGSYGSFYDTGSQTATSATAIYSMSLNTTDISNGVFVSGSDKTRVYVTNAGVYNFQFSAQFRNTDTSDEQHVAVWVRKNNISSANDIVDSNSFVSVSKAKGGNPGETIAAWNFFLQLAAGDFIQLLWHAETANVITLETIPAGVSPTHPRTPSLILTANRVDTFLSNTGSFSGSFTGNLTGTASYATTASYALNVVSINTSSFATTGSNTFIGDQTISGSLTVSGSVTADNLWYRYTLTNLPLNTAGTYTIVPVTPGYKFVPMKVADPNDIYNTTCQLENNSDTNTVSISNFIRVGNTLDENAIGKYTPGGGGTFLSPNQIIAGFDLANGRSYMVSIDIYPIIVTVDGYAGDTNPIDITIAGYLKKI